MKIITTVGTSLITNKSGRHDWLELDNEEFSLTLFEEGNYFFRSEIKPKEAKLDKDVENVNSCAELASLAKIDPEGKAEIHLLCTETMTSYMCGRVLQKHLGKWAKLHYIADLRIDDPDKFETTGFLNLIEKVKEITEGDDNKTILNISGGYKILIPPMTLIAQLEKMSLHYLHEDTEKCIEIGNLPLNFDWEVIEEFVVYLHNENKRNNASSEVIEKMRSLKLVKNDSTQLSIIGSLLKKYSDRESPFTNTIFGYFVEHKVAEYYQNEYGRDKVEHSFNPYDKGTEDIDVLILPETGYFISAEIKPDYVLEDEAFLSKITKNMIDRTKAAMSSKGVPKEVWLIVYSYTSFSKPSFQLTQTQEELLGSMQKEFYCAIGNEIAFRVKHFFIEKNKLGGERHIYQSFMKKSLKTISDLYPIIK